MTEIIIYVLVALIVLNCMVDSREGFLTSRPDEAQREGLANVILADSSMFDRPLNTVKGKHQWMDAVTYEDLRMLKNANKLNKKNILTVLK